VSQDSEQQKDVNFVSIRYFLVEASMDVFFMFCSTTCTEFW